MEELKTIPMGYWKKLSLFLLFTFWSVVGVFAQSTTITGVVLDSSKEPIPGVSVIIKDTQTGTITNLDGAFTINAKPSDILEFSFIGMKGKSVQVGNKTIVNVTLEDDSFLLEETVVIGYGTAKAKDLTSPIATISNDQVTKHITASPMQALQGQVSGVQIVSSGQPGSSPTVRVRGAGNFDSGKQGPLYVVDGMMFENIDFLSSNDIENISILKDASSAAIYGVRAANGVVLVTTKKGMIDRKPEVTYDGYVGFQKASNVLKMANSSQYSTFMREAGDKDIIKIIDNSINLWGGKDGVPSANTDWYDQLLKTALIHSHSVGVTGGGKDVSYSIGASYLYQDGVMSVDNDFERINVRGRIDANITSWLKAGVNFVLVNSDQQTNGGNAWLAAYHNPSIYPVYDDSMKTDKNPKGFASPQQIGMANYFWNPYAIAFYGQEQTTKRTQILPSYYVEANLLDSKLTFKTSLSQNIEFMRYRYFMPSYNIGGDLGSGQVANSSSLQKRTEFNNNYIWDNTVTYRDSFGKHNFTAMVGNSVRKEHWELLRAEGTAIPEGKEEYWYIHNGLQKPQDVASEGTWADNGNEFRGTSFFGRVMYDFDSKYLISATMRADGTSKYQTKWGYFPSVGLGWVLSEENFMQKQSLVNFLKLRANWGKLGNDKNRASDGFASISNIDGIFDENKYPGYTSMSIYSTLKWELTEEYDFGFDFEMFDNRLSGTFDYYRRTTNNAIFAKKLPYGAGSVLVNGGKIRNSGFEVALNWNDKIGKDFSYTIGLNFSTLKNRVKSLNGLDIMEGNDGQVKMVGQPIDVFYGYKVVGVYQNQAEIEADPIAKANNLVPGDLKYQDTDGDGILTADDRVVLGSHIPKYNLGGNLGFNYKNFDFSLAFQGQFKYKIYNKKRTARSYQSSLNMDREWYDRRWTGEGSSNSYPSASGSNRPWNIGKTSSFFLESGSYFTIQNIQLGYTFYNLFKNSPNKSSLRLNITAERPFNFFSYNGFTTNISNGIDSNVYPMASTFSFGVKFTY